jgi:DNA-binding NarL/FixJ family response regulator
MAAALSRALDADSAFDVNVLDEPGELLGYLGRRQPDLLVADFGVLVRHLSADQLAEARALFPALKLLVIVQAADEATLLACIQAGAAGWVSKDQGPADLVQAAERVCEGEVLFAPELLVSLLAKRGAPQPMPALPGPRELEVLRGLAEGLGTVEIAERLCVSPHTVRTHLQGAMTRLKARSRLEAVVLALKAGLIELPGALAAPHLGSDTYGRAVAESAIGRASS